MASQAYKQGDLFTITFEFNDMTFQRIKSAIDMLAQTRTAVELIGIPIYDFLFGRRPFSNEN